MVIVSQLSTRRGPAPRTGCSKRWERRTPKSLNGGPLSLPESGGKPNGPQQKATSTGQRFEYANRETETSSFVVQNDIANLEELCGGDFFRCFAAFFSRVRSSSFLLLEPNKAWSWVVFSRSFFSAESIANTNKPHKS